MAKAPETGLTVEIPASPGMDDAVSLLSDLRALPAADPLTFDASQVETMTTPYLLTIVSALNTRTDQAPPAKVLNPSSAFVDAFTDLGLFQDLMKMEFVA